MNSGLQSWMAKRRNELKISPTRAEKILIDRLNADGVRFSFQKFIFVKGVRRIFDFYIPKTIGIKKAIAIEVDGSCHDDKTDQIKDRNTRAVRKNIEIMRFKNEEVYESIDRVAGAIYAQIALLKHFS